MIVLHFSMQVEGILEHTNAKCHMITLMIKLYIIGVSYPLAS